MKHVGIETKFYNLDTFRKKIDVNFIDLVDLVASLWYFVTFEGLPGVLGNKGTSPFTFREQGIFQNNF